MRFYFFLLFFVLISLNNAVASPWLQQKGKAQVINSVIGSVYDSGNLDVQSKKLSDPSVYSVNYNLYLEYGLGKGHTIGLNHISSVFGLGEMGMGFSNMSIDDEHVSYGMLFTEGLYRAKLIQTKHFIWSLEFITKSPGIHNGSDFSQNFFNSKDQLDFEFKTNFGFSFQDSVVYGVFGNVGESGFFFGGSVGYRYRLNMPFDEIRIELLSGVHLGKRVTLILQFFKILFLNQRAIDNSIDSVGSYHFGKFILYTVYKINDTVSTSLGLIFDVNVNNSKHEYNNIIGSGLSFGIWLVV